MQGGMRWHITSWCLCKRVGTTDQSRIGSNEAWLCHFRCSSPGCFRSQDLEGLLHQLLFFFFFCMLYSTEISPASLLVGLNKYSPSERSPLARDQTVQTQSSDSSSNLFTQWIYCKNKETQLFQLMDFTLNSVTSRGLSEELSIWGAVWRSPFLKEKTKGEQ